MAYIGSVPATQYTRINKQTITGTGNTVYQLDNAVGSEAELEVFVNSVRQEPAVSYTVSGQTITFSEALTSNDSVYVIFQGKAMPSGTIPEKDNNGNYSFDGNTLFVDAANNEVGIGISNPTSNLHVIGTANITSQLLLGANLNFDSTQSTKIVDPGANVMSFFTAQSERMRIDANGNVGIGTATTSARLDLGVTTADSKIAVFGQGGNDGNFRTFIKNGPSTAGSVAVTKITMDYATTYTDLAGMWFNRTAGAGGIISFYTNENGNGIERMRITSDGRVGVGTSAPNGRITASNYNFGPLTNFNGAAITLYGSYGGGIVLLDSSDPNSGTGYALWVDDTSNDFNIARGATNSAASGGVFINNGATSWSARSDERDKLNLEPIENALTKVQSLRAVTGEYVWAEGIRHPFLIAQDVQAILPEAVSIANKSAPLEEQRLGISYTDMIPLLVAAIKEQQTEINNLKARIKSLEV